MQDRCSLRTRVGNHWYSLSVCVCLTLAQGTAASDLGVFSREDTLDSSLDRAALRSPTTENTHIHMRITHENYKQKKRWKRHSPIATQSQLGWHIVEDFPDGSRCRLPHPTFVQALVLQFQALHARHQLLVSSCMGGGLQIGRASCRERV